MTSNDSASQSPRGAGLPPAGLPPSWVRLWIVDSFTTERWRGNPAGLVTLADPAPESWMQAVAAEVNAAETASPAVGIPENPVTGSAHCTLGPLWAPRLGRNEMVAHQVSARGGRLLVRLVGGRVELTGSAVTTVVGAVSGP